MVRCLRGVGLGIGGMVLMWSCCSCSRCRVQSLNVPHVQLRVSNAYRLLLRSMISSTTKGLNDQKDQGSRARCHTVHPIHNRPSGAFSQQGRALNTPLLGISLFWCSDFPMVSIDNSFVYNTYMSENDRFKAKSRVRMGVKKPGIIRTRTFPGLCCLE
jgi:hypothetical protein